MTLALGRRNEDTLLNASNITYLSPHNPLKKITRFLMAGVRGNC